MMPRRTLPDHPDLGQLKRRAKELLHAARAGDAGARSRFRILPAFSAIPETEFENTTLALHDAQSVLAREHGFDSWKRLAERVEETAFRLEDAARAFVEAATDGRIDRAARLLESYPRLPEASFHAALVSGDAASIDACLAGHPARALRPGGVRGWAPLLYVCHTALHRSGRADPEGLVAIAKRLLEAGADPNARFPWLHHGVHRPVLWGAMLVTGHLPLSEVLLRAGADPNDGVTLPLAASGDDTRMLDMLHSHGADPDQPWATDGSAAIYAVLQWANRPTGVLWLLEHGADPDPVFAGNGETPLHTVARRWDPDMAEALVSRGADVSRRRADGRTPYAIAELNGNRAVADWLLVHGASDAMEPVDRLVAACSRADRTAAMAILAAQPSLKRNFRAEHYAALHRAAERGDVEALETMLECGFDPDRGDDEIGKTALHSAAMAGQVEVVRALLAHGASPSVRDREFDAPPLVWAAEGSLSQPRGDAGHAEAGRLLLDADDRVTWDAGEEPSEALVEVLESWRRRHARDRA